MQNEGYTSLTNIFDLHGLKNNKGVVYCLKGKKKEGTFLES